MAANAVKYIALTGGIAALGWAVMHYTSPNRDVFIEVNHLHYLLQPH
jgi:hypothetical protein